MKKKILAVGIIAITIVGLMFPVQHGLLNRSSDNQMQVEEESVIPQAFAHEDPEGCTDTGVSTSIGVFSDAGATNSITQAVQGMTVFFRGTLNAAPPPNCAYEAGSVNFVSPDGTITTVIADGAVQCIGGTTEDPGTAPHDCLEAEQVTSQDTAIVSYVIDIADDGTPFPGDGAVNGILTGRLDYGNAIGTGSVPGFSHRTVNDIDQVASSTTIGVQVLSANTTLTKVAANATEPTCDTSGTDPVCNVPVTILYQFNETNTGEVNLVNATVTDDNTECNSSMTLVDQADGDEILEVGESWIFECTVSFDSSDLGGQQSTEITNEAFAEAEVCEDPLTGNNSTSDVCNQVGITISGDDNVAVDDDPNTEFDSGEQAEETIIIQEISASMVTERNDNVGSSSDGVVNTGSSITDTATVTQDPITAPVPTGNVTFFVCGPGTTPASTVTPGSGCVSGGEELGTVNLDGSGQATSPAFTVPFVLDGGEWCFRAEYNGDENYPPLSETNDASTTTEDPNPECFTTQATTVQLTTQVDPEGAIPESGVTVTDTATITPSNSQAPTPTGTVDFFVCFDSDGNVDDACATGGTLTCEDVPVGSDSGNSGEATCDFDVPDAVEGEWCFRAVYTGDGEYAGASDTEFNANTECFFRAVVAGTPVVIVIDAL